MGFYQVRVVLNSGYTFNDDFDFLEDVLHVYLEKLLDLNGVREVSLHFFPDFTNV